MGKLWPARPKTTLSKQANAVQLQRLSERTPILLVKRQSELYGNMQKWFPIHSPAKGRNILGIIEAISKASNTTSHTSGTAWSASILDGLVAENYDNSNGDLATDIFMGSYLRKETDGFTQKSNVVVNGPGVSTIVRTVSTYQTAFSTLSIHTHRYVQQSGDATGRVLAIRPEKLKVAFLESPYIDNDIARTGTAKRRSVNASMTLETRNQDSNFFADGFNIGWSSI